ncbi:hypothetical protein X739_31560 [Mesorhizobium sp. LNHC220B00]|nr:hypothetical protein X739_31560 [Mesorhizobium sp. LNHC220B00]
MPLRRILVRALVSGVLMVGAGVALAATMGVSATSAVLFALSCRTEIKQWDIGLI